MSLNDPQWGNRGGDDGGKPNNGGGPRRPNQGPPDLEELWRDFNRRLNGLFGKKGGGNNGGGGDGPRLRAACLRGGPRVGAALPRLARPRHRRSAGSPESARRIP